MNRVESISFVFVLFLSIGGMVHIISHFISNGHLNVQPFLWLRTKNCTVFEIWGEYIFGFGVWFSTLIFEIMGWYVSVCSISKLSDVLKYLDCRLFSGRALLRVVVSIGPMVLLVVICLVTEFSHGIELDKQLGYCHTDIEYKLAIVVGLCICCIMMLFIMFYVLSKLEYKRIEQYPAAKSIVQVSSYSLVFLLFLNVTGWNSHSWARVLDMCIMTFMYTYSVMRLSSKIYMEQIRISSLHWSTIKQVVSTKNEAMFKGILTDPERSKEFGEWMNARHILMCPPEFTDDTIIHVGSNRVVIDRFIEVKPSFSIEDNDEEDDVDAQLNSNAITIDLSNADSSIDHINTVLGNQERQFMISPKDLYPWYKLCVEYKQAISDGENAKAIKLRRWLYISVCTDDDPAARAEENESASDSPKKQESEAFTPDDDGFDSHFDIEPELNSHDDTWISWIKNLFVFIGKRAKSQVNSAFEVNRVDASKLPLCYLTSLSLAVYVNETDEEPKVCIDSVNRVHDLLYYLLTNYYTPKFMAEMQTYSLE